MHLPGIIHGFFLDGYRLEQSLPVFNNIAPLIPDRTSYIQGFVGFRAYSSHSSKTSTQYFLLWKGFKCIIPNAITVVLDQVFFLNCLNASRRVNNSFLVPMTDCSSNGSTYHPDRNPNKTPVRVRNNGVLSLGGSQVNMFNPIPEN